MSTPSLRVAFDRVLADMRGGLHTCFPAQITAYDVQAQTVDVAPAIMREIESDDPSLAVDFDALPELIAVQVMWPRAGTKAITFPLSVGDWVMVLCAEQSTLLWRSEGEPYTHPGLHDPHGLNGCVALPGWYPDSSRLSNVSADDMVMGDLEQDATVRIKPDGEIVIGGVGAGALVLASQLKTFLGSLSDAITAATAAASSPPATGVQALAIITTALETWMGAYPLGTTKVRAR